MDKCIQMLHLFMCLCVVTASMWYIIQQHRMTAAAANTFPGVLSDFQHCLRGTRWHKQFWSATLWLLFLKLNLNLWTVNSGFHWTLIRLAASAFEVTTVWRCINSIIMIIIITSTFWFCLTSLFFQRSQQVLPELL